MEVIKSFWFRLAAAMLIALCFNLSILLTIPPATPLGIMLKDAASLILGGAIYFWILRNYED